jgi:hypothetical protein
MAARGAGTLIGFLRGGTAAGGANLLGGNVTGFTDMSSEIVPKQFGLLHELLPRVTRFGVLITRNYPYYDRMSTDARSAAATLGGKEKSFSPASLLISMQLLQR